MPDTNDTPIGRIGNPPPPPPGQPPPQGPIPATDEPKPPAKKGK